MAGPRNRRHAIGLDGLSRRNADAGIGVRFGPRTSVVLNRSRTYSGLQSSSGFRSMGLAYANAVCPVGRLTRRFPVVCVAATLRKRRRLYRACFVLLFAGGTPG